MLLALLHPEVYETIAKGTRRHFANNKPRAVLFEGPPGTGKTTSARSLPFPNTAKNTTTSTPFLLCSQFAVMYCPQMLCGLHRDLLNMLWSLVCFEKACFAGRNDNVV